MKLLQKLVNIHAPSGEEFRVKSFLVDHIKSVSKSWKVQPEIIEGDHLGDVVILKFGVPRTAIFAHMDSVGFTVRYEDQLLTIGGAEAEDGYWVTGEDKLGPIRCKLRERKGHVFYDFGRGILPGTTLVFESEFTETRDYIQSAFLDNRLGIYCALQVAETLENGLIVFTANEEHGGGSVPVALRHIMEHFPVRQALVCDITWITDAVRPGKGVVVSLRDRNIPRRPFLDKILELADAGQIPYQLEVEGGGSSDGREIHESPYAIDWCFIGAAEQNVHSPFEKVHKADIQSMIAMYAYLMQHL